MTTRFGLRLALGASFAFLVLAPCAFGEEPFAEFLHALQERGYGEQALAYIEEISQRSDVPVELRQTFDLERSRSLRLAADEAYDAAQRKARLDESKALLDKFLKDNPNHPAVGQALNAWGNEQLNNGILSLAESRGTKDKAEQEKLLVRAREQLADAKTRFQSAEKTLKERLDRMPRPSENRPLPKREAEAREDAEFAWLESRFNLARIDYLTAQTYADPKDAKRKELLIAAGKGFDSIFQEYRLSDTPVKHLTHMWHGRTIDELGDMQTALDIYDEVLVASPEGSDAKPDLADIFGTAELFRLKLLAKKEDPLVVAQEADEWLKLHRKWSGTAAYQGIALEMARATVALADKATGAEQKKGYREALGSLAAIAKVDTEHKHEALLMRRELVEKMGSGEGTLSPDESIALGDVAATEKNWAEAMDLYKQAFEAGQKAKNEKLIAAAVGRLNNVRYRIAVDQYSEGQSLAEQAKLPESLAKMQEALTLATDIVRDGPDGETAPQASALAIAAALAIYSSASGDQKTAALQRLEQIAKFTISKWSDKPEADEARMALAQAHVLRGDFAGATAVLNEVNENSKHYGAALNIAARINWKSYLDGKKAPDAAKKQEDLAKLRAEVRDKLRTSLAKQMSERVSGEGKLPTPIFETQLLLAEVLMEDQNPAEAATLFEPLVQDLKANKPAAIENPVLRAFVGAVRSHLAAENTAKAGEAAVSLLEISDDTAQLNSILVDFTKLIVMEMKKAEAAVTEAEAAMDADATTKARDRLDNIKQVLGQMLDKLALREQHSVQNLVFIGDTCSQLALNDKAREVYQRLLALIEKDETAKATAGKAITRVRAQLIGLLRNEAKYDEANKQVDALIKANPNALEPLMEKGRILQSWAQREPKRYPECVAHWTQVRQLLGRLKTRPPEYYEVLYNAALCLMSDARNSKDKEKALQAEQMLKSTLTLSPSLSGPDMVAKYKALLSQAMAYQGKSPTITLPTSTEADTGANGTGAGSGARTNGAAKPAGPTKTSAPKAAPKTAPKKTTTAKAGK